MAKIEIPIAFEGLFRPSRYKVYYGGRGGAKSWAFADALLCKAAYEGPRLIVCAREYQASIEDSVYRLLKNRIAHHGWDGFFRVLDQSIRSRNGSEVIFKGLHHNIDNLKSLEGADICWVEEAQVVGVNSWDKLIPTIRKEGSEIWISLNPDLEDDETYQRFIKNPPDDAIIRQVGWEDNPYLPDTLRKEMEYCRRVNPEGYANIWGGECRRYSDAQIFKGRYAVEPFETPDGVQFYHGVDWGFANDPTVMIRAFVQDDRLYVDMETYGVGVELDETPQLFDAIPTARAWPIKADCARPETISHIGRKGFQISAAKKWGGSVEDGITILKGFEKIIIHPRCVHMAQEAKMYSYKVDKNTGEVLPIIMDAWNHCWDALRYGLDGYIKGKMPMRFKL